MAPRGKKSKAPSIKVARKSLALRKSIVPKHSVENVDVSEAQIVQSPTSPTEPMLVGKNYVRRAVEKLFDAQADPDAKRKELFELDEAAVFLNVSLVKIPKTQKKTIGINLAHSTVPKDAEIVFIAAALKKEKVDEFEKNVEHHRSLFAKHGVNCIKEIIPWHQLKADYKDYEMQGRLMGLYDMMLVDSSIDGYVKKTFGHLIEKHHMPYRTIKLGMSNLHGAVEKVLLQTHLTIHGNGDMYSIRIGHMSLMPEELVENVMMVVNELDEKLPGGFGNVKALHLRVKNSNSIQFYLSAIDPNDVKVPVVPKKALNGAIEGELSTELDAQVVVHASGQVTVKNGNEMKEEAPTKRVLRERKVPPVIEEVVAPKKKKAAPKRKVEKGSKVEKGEEIVAKKKKKAQKTPVASAAKPLKAAPKPTKKATSPPKSPKKVRNKAKPKSHISEEVVASAPQEVKKLENTPIPNSKKTSKKIVKNTDIISVAGPSKLSQDKIKKQKKGAVGKKPMKEISAIDDSFSD